MTQQTTAVQQRTQAQPPARKAATIADFLETEKWASEIKKVLPTGFPLDAVIRVARSAASDPKFANATPVSFLQALLKCARAGLYPDGREAHLMCFGREVTVIFDVKGIITLASRAGILVTPKLVYENDEFTVHEDDGDGKTKVLHTAEYRKGRGELQLVYSRAVLPNGQVDYEFMTADEVDHVRKTYSKQSEKGPWKDSFGEMAKKTVIKRHSKRWDMAPEIRQALNDDDDSSLPAPEKKVSAPIFTEPEPPKQVEAPKAQMAESKGKPAQKKPAPTIEVVSTAEADEHMALVDKVRGLCERDDIGEITLIKYVENLGMSNPGDKTLNDLQEPDLETIIERWEELADGIRSEPSA